MSDEARVQQLLDEILDTERTPEEVCGTCPELLPEIRRRWQQMQIVKAEVEALFPLPPDTGADAPSSPHPGASLPCIPGYEVEAVLGHGGMGVVYKARHLRLNRPVALKMLLAGAYAGPRDLLRFQSEAQAVAALRHPNVVQVYDVGDHEGRPYFTMEFIEGGSLAQKLAGTPQPARQAAAVVAALAEGVGVLHQAGIVHRDLKPANVLLTADGTPRISDFGLARRLEPGPGLTLSGTTVGTPSYMAPEQAQGKTLALGPPTDIYALGAILYELLTGRPPFRAETAAATVQQVISQDPVAPSRLNARVPRDLETICLKCLHKDPGRRYASATALADDLRCFLGGEAIAARPEGRLERLARGMRRRPTLVVGLTASVVLATALVGGWLWLSWERAATALATEQLERVNQARRDQEFVARLDAIRLNRAAVVDGNFDKRFNKAQADREYEVAFHEAGLAEVHDDVEVAAARVEASNIRQALVDALDDWAACVRTASDQRRQGWLLELARRADRDATGLRDRLRDPAVRRNRAALTELAGTALAAKASVQLLVVFGERLRDAGGDAIPFLTRVQQEHPGDFWANFILGDALWANNPGEAIRYYQAALAVRPGAAVAHNNLGRALALNARLDEASAHFQQALRIDPTFAHAYSNLGNVLRAKGRPAEALQNYHLAVRHGPKEPSAHSNLGVALIEAARPNEALSHFREAIRLDPKHAAAHTGLGRILQEKGLLDEAIEHYREAVRIYPGNPPGHVNLANSLRARGRLAEALASDREALRLDPKDVLAHTGLGNTLKEMSRLAEAGASYREALRLNPRHAPAHTGLGIVLNETGRLAEAIDHYRQAADLDPWKAKAHYNLALALAHNSQLDEAIAQFEQALRIDPKLAEAHGALGLALLGLGHFGEAKGALRRCLDLLPPTDKRRAVLEQQVQACDRWLALEARLPAILQGKDKPADGTETFQFGELCRLKKQHVAAVRLFADAFARKPQLVEEPRNGKRYNAARAAALAGCGRGEDGAGLGDAKRARWRAQARDWLHADLALWVKMAGGPVAGRVLVRKALNHWRTDPALAGLREPGALEKLPAEERQKCLALWSEVDAVLNGPQQDQVSIAGFGNHSFLQVRLSPGDRAIF